MSDLQTAPRSTLHAPRPFSVMLLAAVVLIFTILNGLRFIMAVRLWEFLSTPPVDVPLLYLTITGAFWAGAGLVVIVGLWFGLNWSPLLTRAAIVLYAIYYWLDRLLVAESMAIAARWPFTIGLTIILLAFTFWTLSRSKTRLFFHQPQA